MEPDLSRPAEFIVRRILPEVLLDGQPPRIPLAAPGCSHGSIADRTTSFIVRIWSGAKASASVSLENRSIDFTHGWFCERWCSTYLLLKSIVIVPAIDEPLIKLLPKDALFAWPGAIPIPETDGDALVEYTNKIFPWVVLPTLLHEVGHVVEAENANSGERLELACDAIASWHLLGKRMDRMRDIVMLGLAVWLCCLCSENRARPRAMGNVHPCPIDRMRQYLNSLVPQQTEMEWRVWMLCVSHVLRLTAILNRARLDEVLSHEHRDLDDLLIDFRRCLP